MKDALSLPDMKTLLDSLDWGISIFDNEGRFLFVNRYVLQTSGRGRQDYEGRTVFDFKESGFINHPVVSLVYRSKKKTSRIQKSVSKSGRVVEYLVTATPIFDSDGNIRYVVADRMELNRMLDRYQQAKGTADAVREAVQEEQTQMIYASPAMEQLAAGALRVAPLPTSVLLLGESGTGKDVLAHFIHDHSGRAGQAMVEINCASMPESLLESELFGYAKGAFTGALSTGKPGLIEAAHHGTLFLDEINSMPLGLQAKLLRVLESKTITRIGSVTPVQVDFRLIAATNEDLRRSVERGAFRADLYYRLNVIPLRLPPLRDRPEDISLLADYFLRYFCEKYSLTKCFSPQVYQALRGYGWPGNVRELKNVVERIVVMSTPEAVQINEIPLSLFSGGAPGVPAAEQSEEERIRAALALHGGHRERTAQYLGISRRTLQYKLKKYQIK